MTRGEVELLFKKNKVPDYFYTFGGLGSGDCFGIEETIVGWELYYSERGHKSTFGKYETEDAACRALVTEVDRRLYDEFNRHIER